MSLRNCFIHMTKLSWQINAGFFDTLKKADEFYCSLESSYSRFFPFFDKTEFKLPLIPLNYPRKQTFISSRFRRIEN